MKPRMQLDRSAITKDRMVWTIKPHNSPEDPTINKLRADFLEAMANIDRAVIHFRDVVVACWLEGIDNEEMIIWAENAGYSEAGARSMLSRILVESGHRRRAPGAGNKPNPEAVALARRVIHDQGDIGTAVKLLQAALRQAVKMLRQGRPRQLDMALA